MSESITQFFGLFVVFFFSHFIEVMYCFSEWPDCHIRKPCLFTVSESLSVHKLYMFMGSTAPVFHLIAKVTTGGISMDQCDNF